MIGRRPSSPRTVSIAYVTAAGSPGPFESKMPSGFNARISSVAGLRRDDCHATATPKECAQRVTFDAIVENDDVMRDGGPVLGYG